MKFLLVVLVLVAAVRGSVFTEEDYQQTRFGPRPDNVDDAESRIACRKGYTITACGCDRPEACDGAYVHVDKDGLAACVAYNRADNKDEKRPAALAKVTCGKLMLRVTTGFVTYDGGKNAPKARCPRNYRLIGCSFTSQHIQHEKPTPVVKRIGGACTIKKPCKRCLIQAQCIRNVNLITT